MTRRKGTVFNGLCAMLLIAGLAAVFPGAAVQAGPSSGEGSGGQGYIGVVMQSLTDDIAKGLGLNTSRGVLIADVLEGSPAEEAGIEDGDVLLEFDGKLVRTPENLKEMVVRKVVGERVKVKIIRNDESKILTLVVGERPEDEGEITWEAEDPEEESALKRFALGVPGELKNLPKDVMMYFEPGRRLGVHAADLNEDLAAYFGVGKDDGVLVLDVEKESVAMEVGIKAGDVIRRIGAEKVDSVAELKDAIREVEAGDSFDIVIARHGAEMTLTGAFEKDSSEKIFLKEHSSRENLPMKRVYRFDSKEMDDLRKEMEQLKSEMQKLKKELKKELEHMEAD
ncbi:MAG: PDZ domain-containing protein [Chitinivibrionia bacterium]|nr:PDZ domain-containing protein [Chitinivibrionia bacterium]